MNNDSEESKFTYGYRLWVPERESFHAVTQHFYQYPHPEYNWNKVDEILSGNDDFLTDAAQGKGVKAKRLHFAVIPDVISNEEDADKYFEKFEKLIAFLKKGCGEGLSSLPVLSYYFLSYPAMSFYSN